jgi:6-phosphogluconolactonase/glucosamine-6-phosphate isomerase/deaminase
MVDERYGEVGHEKSNANMMLGFEPFYSILNGESLENTALHYDKTVRSLFDKSKKSIGILGIGSDGHTAGIPAGIKNYESRIKNGELVSFFDNFPGENPKRVTMTFNALAKLDQILILVFGEDLPAGRQGKKEALRKMFESGPIEEIPARFYLRPEISKKTILVTDQKL